MVEYPINVRRDYYRGSNERRRMKAYETNQYATRIEQTVNALLERQTADIQSYFWDEIASESGVPMEIVKDLGYSIDGGSGGFTAVRKGLTMQEALANMDKRIAQQKSN